LASSPKLLNQRQREIDLERQYIQNNKPEVFEKLFQPKSATLDLKQGNAKMTQAERDQQYKLE
jgi:hypothetical protein